LRPEAVTLQKTSVTAPNCDEHEGNSP